MAGSFYRWSSVAANNATIDPSINFSEGEAPSALNDSSRAVMAALASYRDDTSGFGNVTGGSATAYTMSSHQSFDTAAHMVGMEVSIYMHATNGLNPTLNVDGLGAFPIVTASGQAVPSATMLASSVYKVLFNTTEWLLADFFGNPYNVPLGGLMDYICPNVPNSNFVFPIGQAISRVTYSALFGLVGTTYGVGDGTTTFNVPDLTGRVAAMKEAVATRLTTAGSGVDGGTLGAAGGLQSKTLLATNLPPQTPAGAIAASGLTTSALIQNNAAGNITPVGGGGTAVPISNPGNQSVNVTANFTGTPFPGQNSTPFATVQPTIILQKILRIF